tara:strand:- start:638 stop:1852 length:1215 start_codon:yes stop_codon:yes gene_type:complete
MGNKQTRQNASHIRPSKFGWKPDLPDNRDHVVDFPEHVIDRIEYKINLGKHFHNYYDDRNTGMNSSCTVASAINFEEERVSGNRFNSSPSFLYYNTRYLEGKENYDSFVGIRDNINCLNKIGVCSQENYNTHNLNEVPSGEVYEEARNFKGFMYKIIKPDLTQIKACLTLRRPIICGFSVPKQYDDPNWNITLEPLIPPKSKGKLLGGRTGLIIGYNDEKKILKIMDSRGESWGNNGIFNMHYDMVTKGLCVNFCTIEKKVSNGSISQLEKPTYSSVTKKKKRRGKKKRKKKSISEESVDSLSEYESEYEHVEVEQEPLKEEVQKDKEVEEKLLNDIEQELNNILGDKESTEESDKESGDFKEISITLGKKKRRRRRKKGKKKKVAFKEEEDEILKNFAFRTEK